MTFIDIIAFIFLFVNMVHTVQVKKKIKSQFPTSESEGELFLNLA